MEKVPVKKWLSWRFCKTVFASLVVVLIFGYYSLASTGGGNEEVLPPSKAPISRKITSAYYAITNVTVIDIQTGARAVKDILVEGEKITAIGLPGSVRFPPHTQVINAVGKFIIPGLWDAHTHLTIVPGYAHQATKLYVANGVTSVRDMGGPLEKLIALRQSNIAIRKV